MSLPRRGSVAPLSSRRPDDSGDRDRDIRSTGLAGSPCCGCLRRAVRPDRGKNHDPAATTPALTSGSRRARSRQDRCAPLRGGLRPVLTQSPRGACNAHGPGRKAALSSRTKSNFWLANTPAIKERRNGSPTGPRTCGKSRWIQKARLAKRVAINGRRDADQRN